MKSWCGDNIMEWERLGLCFCGQDLGKSLGRNISIEYLFFCGHGPSVE